MRKVKEITKWPKKMLLKLTVYILLWLLFPRALREFAVHAFEISEQQKGSGEEKRFVFKRIFEKFAYALSLPIKDRDENLLLELLVLLHHINEK
jgi:hypothetical protein